MKKILVIILIDLLIVLISILVFTKKTNSIDLSREVRTNISGFHRQVFENNAWKDWWPGDNSQDGFEQDGVTFSIIDKKLNALNIDVSYGGDSMMSELILLSYAGDSAILTWKAEEDLGWNPVKRVKSLLGQTRKEEAMSEIIDQLLKHYSSEKNLYGIEIKKELVKDSILMSTYMTTDREPDNDEVYSMVRKLEQYVRKHDAVVTGPPMLNLSRDQNNNYVTKVALPVNKRLPDSRDISYKWMLGGGNILSAEIKGGRSTIEKGWKSLEDYVSDHKRIAPAIYFESMITNRLEEKDSSKWKTKLYYPVM